MTVRRLSLAFLVIAVWGWLGGHRPAVRAERGHTMRGGEVREEGRHEGRKEGRQEALRILSFGAGVQSTTVLLLALNGSIPQIDHVIFADTGWEPPDVYDHLDRCVKLMDGAGLPFHQVSNGDIREIGAFGVGSAADAPWFLQFEDGGDGMGRRQCTSKLKILPIRRKVRELMTTAGAKRAIQVFGISVDEWQRMRKPDVKYLTHDYPLVDREWSRQTCLAYLAKCGISAPRSACVVCPYHTNTEWRRIRDRFPMVWDQAVAFDGRLRDGLEYPAQAFVHRQRVPLGEVDLSIPEDSGQLTLNDECEGMCGV